MLILPSSVGAAGGATTAFRADLFPSLISCEGAFSGVVESLELKTFSGRKPRDPEVGMV